MLLDIYRGFDIINKFVEHYNETKYGVLFVTTSAVKIRKMIRELLKTDIRDGTDDKELLESYINYK